MFKLTHGRELYPCQLANEPLVLVKGFFLGDNFEGEVAVATLGYVGFPVIIVVTVAVGWTEFLPGVHNHLHKLTEGEVPVPVVVLALVARVLEFIVIRRDKSGKVFFRLFSATRLTFQRDL